MQPSRLFKLALAAALAAGVGAPTVARAEEPYPGALQEAAGLDCVPSCIICHTTNPGSGTTWQTRKLALAVLGNGATKGSGEDGLKKAYAKLVADAKGTGPTAANAADIVAKLEAGLDPETGEEICQVKYGCGARIAKETPRDDWSGLLFVAGAMGFGALLRRTKRR